MPSAWSYFCEETYADWLTLCYLSPTMYPFTVPRRSWLDKQYVQDGVAALGATPGLFVSYLAWNIAHTLPFGNTYRYAFPQYVVEYSKTNSVAEHGVNRLMQEVHKQALQNELSRHQLDKLTVEQVNNYLVKNSAKVAASFTALLSAVTTEALKEQPFSPLIPHFFDKPNSPSGIMQHYWLAYWQYTYAHYVPWEAMELLPAGTVTGWFLQAAEDISQGAMPPGEPLQPYFDKLIKEYAGRALQDSSYQTMRKFAVLWHVVRSLRGRQFTSDYPEPTRLFYHTALGTKNQPHANSVLAACANAGKLDQPPGSLQFPRGWTMGSTKQDSRFYVERYADSPYIDLSAYVQASSAASPAHELIWLHKDYQLTGERFTVQQYTELYGDKPDEDIVIDGYIYAMRNKRDTPSCYRMKPVADSIVWWAFLPRLVVALLMTIVQWGCLAIQLMIALLYAVPSAFYFYMITPLTTPTGRCALSMIAVVTSALMTVQAYTIWFPLFQSSYSAVVSAIVAMGWSSASVVVLIQTSCVVMLLCAFAAAECSLVNMSTIKLTDREATKSSVWRPLQLLCGSACGALFLYAAILYPGVAAFDMTPALAVGMGLGVTGLSALGLLILTARIMALGPTMRVADSQYRSLEPLSLNGSQTVLSAGPNRGYGGPNLHRRSSH